VGPQLGRRIIVGYVAGGEAVMGGGGVCVASGIDIKRKFPGSVSPGEGVTRKRERGSGVPVSVVPSSLYANTI